MVIRHQNRPFAVDNRTKFIIAAIFGLMLIRILAIFITPLGLDVEEAQYWLWSTTPSAGYFTKPPMIAWVIGIGTALAGEQTFGVRLMAPIMQAISSLLIWRAASIAYTPAAGRWAALIWTSIPATALGGFIISTDSPMLVFLLSALLLLAPLAALRPINLTSALLAGIFTGLAMMSKYAAIYLPVGLVIWWGWQGRHHQLVTLRHVGLYAAGLAVSILPNLVWNLHNGFVTARHLSHNANLEIPQYSLISSIEFILSQAGIVGPIIFILAIIALIRGGKHGVFWLALFAPPIIVITIQAFLSDANANWAIASWPAAVILLAGMLASAGPKLIRVGIVGISFNALLAGGLIIAAMVGSFGQFTPASDPLRRLKAWDDHRQDLIQFAEANGASTIITERRGVAAKLIWQLRDTSYVVELTDRNGIAENHFEQQHPWTPTQGRKVILVNEEQAPSVLSGVTWHGVTASSYHQISAKRQRQLVFHLGTE